MASNYVRIDKVALDLLKNDKEYKEYIIDLSSNDQWGGTVTQLRVDPVNSVDETVSVTADFYIDSIEFLKEKP